ncbi:hypothetical protein [Trueperella bialowiezensis]|uniref:Uncharacterized protein n=1 Tax=Trueperella bialowiezensis TaxID=312285 RepID=A0A448PG72_9ACTO|nr:hypothetical protein [Trueperella bialowiezensis]VEI13908.1 Uncharacterised protein [Trueperella bialowiezensis]
MRVLRTLARCSVAVAAAFALGGCADSPTPPEESATDSSDALPSEPEPATPETSDSHTPMPRPDAGTGLAADALSTIDDLDYAAFNVEVRSSLLGDQDALAYSLAANYGQGDEVELVAVDGREPNPHDPLPLLRSDMRLLLDNTVFTSPDSAGLASGTVAGGLEIPSGSQIATPCGQDGSWQVVAGSVQFHSDLSAVRSISYSLETDDFAQTSSAPDGVSTCEVTWTATAVNGQTFSDTP